MTWGTGSPANCNRIRTRGEPGLMKWLISLIIGLMILGQASWSQAQTNVLATGEVHLTCAICCDSETGTCAAVRALCERACSAAILPAPAFIPRPPTRLVHVPLRAGSLASRATRPALPPPRAGEV